MEPWCRCRTVEKAKVLEAEGVGHEAGGARVEERPEESQHHEARDLGDDVGDQ